MARIARSPLFKGFEFAENNGEKLKTLDRIYRAHQAEVGEKMSEAVEPHSFFFAIHHQRVQIFLGML